MNRGTPRHRQRRSLCTHGQTDGQLANIIPPAPVGGGDIIISLTSNCKYMHCIVKHSILNSLRVRWGNSPLIPALPALGSPLNRFYCASSYASVVLGVVIMSVRLSHERAITLAF